MSSLCGIIDLNGRTLNFDRLNSMGKALILRGKEQSGAYVQNGVGIQHNRNIVSGSLKDRQPLISTRNGYTYVVAFDGEITNRYEIGELLGASVELTSAEAVLEAYITYGKESLSLLEGAFAFAVYDVCRKELLLAKDKQGSRPLYYTSDSSKLIFSSEIKGLLSYGGESFEIDVLALSELIRGELGAISGGELYKNISELPDGSFAIYSRLGLQIFSFRGGETDKTTSRQPRKADIDLSPPSVFKTLREVLFAFDYPCFDEYMSGYMTALSAANGANDLLIEDATLGVSRRYSFERADRLGVLCGTTALSVPAKESRDAKKKELSAIEKKLSDAVGELFNSENRISSLLGKDFYEAISRESNQRRRIRAYAKTLQTELWLENYCVIPS